MTAASVGTGGGGGAEGLRFKDFPFKGLAGGRGHARGGLGGWGGRQFWGGGQGVPSQTGGLRCCAAAAVQALEQAVQTKVAFELLGVKAVRAFDATVVIVSLSAREPESASRLVGSYLTESDPSRGAALAVLNATNRILGNFFATR